MKIHHPQKMKRQRARSPIFSPKISPPFSPSTPPTLNHLLTQRQTKSTIKSSKAKRHLNPTFSNLSSSWEPLHIGRSELFLPLTFPTGQTFTWKQTGPSQYTGSINSHLISLKQMDGHDDASSDVSFFIHRTPNRGEAESALRDYLNLGVSLSEMWREFSGSDSRFADLAPHLTGARILRQDPIECLFQFLCSSNNNIGRITKMVGVLSSFGGFLGNVGDFDFHEFPSLEQLSRVSEEELRKAGFGYRSGL